jgi:hypothetical protein
MGVSLGTTWAPCRASALGTFPPHAGCPVVRFSSRTLGGPWESGWLERDQIGFGVLLHYPEFREGGRAHCLSVLRFPLEKTHFPVPLHEQTYKIALRAIFAKTQVFLQKVKGHPFSSRVAKTRTGRALAPVPVLAGARSLLVVPVNCMFQISFFFFSLCATQLPELWNITMIEKKRCFVFQTLHLKCRCT